MLHCLLQRRPGWMRLADQVIRIFSVAATWALSYTVTCMKDNDSTARPLQSRSSTSMVLKFSSRQQNFNNQVLKFWEDWEMNSMCLDTCLASANVTFLLRTHQLPWAWRRKWLFRYARNGAQDIGWKQRETMVKQTSVCGYVESLANGRWLANPFIVAVFTGISNLSFICLVFGLFNTQTDDQQSKRLSLKVSANIYNRAAIAHW